MPRALRPTVGAVRSTSGGEPTSGKSIKRTLEREEREHAERMAASQARIDAMRAETARLSEIGRELDRIGRQIHQLRERSRGD